MAQFLFPLPVCLFLSSAGLALLWWTSRQKLGKVLVTVGLGLLALLSYGPVADSLLAPLEHQYPLYARGQGPPVKFVVVLGGGCDSDPSVSVTSQIGNESLKRLIEGIRVHRLNFGSKLVLSGGGWVDPVPEARIEAQVARVLGILDSDILLEEESKDTRDQARLVKALVTTNRFVLVTSASHMPRSMRLFERAGMDPIAAPAEHLALNRRSSPGDFFPQARGLWKSQRAFYEYLGFTWEILRQQI